MRTSMRVKTYTTKKVNILNNTATRQEQNTFIK